MFGPIMEFKAGAYEIRLAPLKREDMPEFVRDGGMQSFIVNRYLGRSGAPVLEDEYEYFDHIRKQENAVSWGIFVKSKGGWLLIGTSAIHDIDYKGMPNAVTGSMIFRPEWWGKGIAKHAHRARSLYAFDYLGLTVVRSDVMLGNEASKRALEGSGYVHVHTVRNDVFREGRWLHKQVLEQVSPEPETWRAWWHGEPVPAKFKAGRLRTKEAMAWAREHVRFA